MANPKFSVLIPTRDRPATLRHTLATVLSQAGDDYEVIVADNCGTAETRAIVDEAARPQLRYVRSDEILPMAENWERGLALCEGEYVTVLGDDDSFVPSTLDMARRLLAATEVELISWLPHTYWWPDTIVPWNRNLLFMNLGNSATMRQSREVLQGFYHDTVGFGDIPMIYSAFFHRGIIEEARRRYDGFFVPRDTAPDISSGILGLHITEAFAYSTRPLSIRGNSGKSNGTAQWARSLGAKQREVYFREERIGLQGIIHKALVPSPNLHVIVASAKLKCREAYFPDDQALSVDLHAVLNNMVQSLNFEPEAYDENLADVRAFAAKLGATLDPDAIPKRQDQVRRRHFGPSYDQGRLMGIGIDCDAIGVQDIAVAARLVDAMLPPADTYLTG